MRQRRPLHLSPGFGTWSATRRWNGPIARGACVSEGSSSNRLFIGLGAALTGFLAGLLEMLLFGGGLDVWALVIAALLLGAAYATLRLWRTEQRSMTAIRRRRSGQCATCGYDLTGNISGICPECGKSIT